MTSKPIVALLDVHLPEVRAIIQAEAPERIELRLATSRDPGELADLAAEAAFFIGGVAPIPASLIDAAPRLRLIHKWGIGVDKIDLAAARRRGIPVAFTAGSNAGPVAEFTILLMLAVLRRLPWRQEQLHAGQWLQARAEGRAESLQLRGKVVGIVGLGAIGREVAKLLGAFGATARYYDVQRPAPDEEAALGVTYRDLDALLPEVEILTLHVPYLDETRQLLSRERIARLKPGAIVINAARGELVDEAALAEALENGHLAGAGIDVFAGEPPSLDNPLIRLRVPGLVVTPHQAGLTFDNVANTARHIFRNVERVLDGEAIRGRDLVR
jgi:D-3-phosphoglycerate dehydrogenase